MMTFSLRGTLLLLLLLGSVTSTVEGQEVVLGKRKGEWIDSLKTEKEAKRRRAAVIALGIIGVSQDDVDRALGDALANDEAIEVRQQVLQVLRPLKKEQLGKWAQRLGSVLKYDKHAANRAQALMVLARMEELAKPVLSNIIAACKDTEPTVRAAAVETIGRIGEDAKDALPDLFALLKDKDYSVRLNSVSALGRLASIATEASPELLRLLQTETDAELKKEIVRVLGYFESTTVAGALTKVLQEEKSEEIRRQAILSLGKLGNASKGEIDKLRAVLKKDTDKTVRLYLIRTLTSILGEGASFVAKDYVAQLAVEQDTDLKLAILQELAAMGNDAKEILPALKPYLEDPSVAVRKEVKVTMDRINAKPAPKKE
jgi:HEAT repeat protein